MPPVKRKPNNASAAKITNQKPNPPKGSIEILGEGKSKHGRRFIKLSVVGGKKPVLVSHHDLISNKKAVFKQLSDQGARLVTTKVQNDLLADIQNYKPSTPLFRVAEEIGLFDDCFILPDCTIPALPNGVEVCLNDIPADTRSKYKTAGTLEGWQELARYANGDTHDNTRMKFAFALNFVGPVSAIWPRQFVGFQLTGPRSSGKSTIAVVSTSTWGWDPMLGKKYGFGTSWNKTVNKLEAICKGYNHTILFLDETGASERKAKKCVDILEAIMRLDAQEEKGRMTDDGPRGVWNMPVLSTSNLSVARMVKVGEPNADPGVYSDRLMDIPVPHNGSGMFENLYGVRDGGEFTDYLKNLAAANHGLAAREFVKRILEKLAKNSHELLDFLDARAADYEQKARARIGPSEELVRIHNKFATVYAAGCLAIREKILPYKGNKLSEAILTCEEDHVRFVNEELGRPSEPQLPRIDILREYVLKNRDDFVDLEKDRLPANHDHANCPGYINKRPNGRSEYLLAEEKLKEIMGGQKAANELKRELHDKGLISTVSAGEGESRYSTRRTIGGQREPVVVISGKICDD